MASLGGERIPHDDVYVWQNYSMYIQYLVMTYLPVWLCFTLLLVVKGVRSGTQSRRRRG